MFVRLKGIRTDRSGPDWDPQRNSGSTRVLTGESPAYPFIIIPMEEVREDFHVEQKKKKKIVGV